jgi:tetratricopeptide (TPR) repeat protein
MTRFLGVMGIAFMTTACGAAVTAPPKTTPPIDTSTPKPPPQDEAKFNAAVELFVAHDKANDWNAATCAEVVKAFEAVPRNAQALFDEGLVYQRCNDDRNAQAKLEAALQIDPKLHHARAQLALYRYKADGNKDTAIAALSQAVTDAEFRNVPALVDLAAVQMARGGAQPGNGCKDDLDCAKLNLQRALAIDETFMPASNQLGLYYLQLATKRAGAGKKADVQQLELAALVCSQAIRRNPNYAPIHNTAGLIENALGHVNGAVSEFRQASDLDAHFFEAHMNYAAVNLGFRGFAQAEKAYRKALEIRPNDYDAHLGLALALRGPITGAEANYDDLVRAAQAELDAAKKADPNRPDAYYNEGILTQEFKAKSGGDKAKTIATLEDAKKSFSVFVSKAADKPQYADAVKRVRGDGKDDTGRLGEIDTAIAFLR